MSSSSPDTYTHGHHESVVKSHAERGIAVEYGLTTSDELEEISAAWAEWGTHRAAWFMIPHGELLITVARG